jgi:hypothetical protein
VRTPYGGLGRHARLYAAHGDPHIARLTHRVRLLAFEIVDGQIFVEVGTELYREPPVGPATPVRFVRDGQRVTVADPGAFPDAYPPIGPETDVREALSQARLRIVLAHRSTDVRVGVPAARQVAATPDYGRPRDGRFTVRFAGSASFDLLATLAAQGGADQRAVGDWDLHTAQDTLGSVTVAPLGPHRDRVSVDPLLAPCSLGDSGLVVDPVLTGFGPRLTLRIARRPPAGRPLIVSTT